MKICLYFFTKLYKNFSNTDVYAKIRLHLIANILLHVCKPLIEKLSKMLHLINIIIVLN